MENDPYSKVCSVIAKRDLFTVALHESGAFDIYFNMVNTYASPKNEGKTLVAIL